MRAQNTTLPDRIGVRQVHHLAWPVMVTMLSHTAMSVADTLFVARLGTAQLAGTGVGATGSFVVLATGFGLAGGARVVVANATGAQDHARARVMAWQGLWIALALGLVGFALAPLAGPLARAFGGSPEVARFGADYLGVRIGGSVLALAALTLSSWFQGRGNTRTPMVANVFANLLNIALDPIFVFGWGPMPAFGVAGAAAATVLSQGVATVILAFAIRRELRGVPARPQWSLILRALHIGAPMALRGALSVGGFAVFVAILARAGDAHLGAHVIVLRIVSVSFLPGHAVGEAAGVLVGQALGAGRPALARQAFVSGTRLAVAIMATMALVFVLFPSPLVRLFSPAPDVLEIAVQLMLIAAAFQLFDAVAMVAQGALNGAGDTRSTLLFGVGTMWLVNLPTGWFLALHLGLGAVGAWLALTAEIVTFAALVLWRVSGGAWIELGLSTAGAGEAAAVDVGEDAAGEDDAVAPALA